jgi:hypothetical protein
MHKNFIWALVLAACGPREVVTIVERACGDAGIEDGGVEDGGVELADAGPADHGCPEGFGPDGPFCVGWMQASAPQSCLDGVPVLVETDVVPTSTDHALLAIACSGELLQLYRPAEDRWERARDVTAVSIEPPVLPPWQGEWPLAAAATLPDGTRVGVAGSLHANPPYETWIADPGASVWRRSIDAPSIWVVGSGAIDDDMLLFAGTDSFLFVRFVRATRAP